MASEHLYETPLGHEKYIIVSQFNEKPYLHVRKYTKNNGESEYGSGMAFNIRQIHILENRLASIWEFYDGQQVSEEERRTYPIGDMKLVLVAKRKDGRKYMLFRQMHMKRDGTQIPTHKGIMLNESNIEKLRQHLPAAIDQMKFLEHQIQENELETVLYEEIMLEDKFEVEKLEKTMTVL